MTHADMTLGEHLEELRRRLWLCVAVVAVLTAASFAVSDVLLDVLLGPLKGRMDRFYFFEPTGAFRARFQVSLLAAIVVSAPVLAYQLWAFLSPALHERERSAVAVLALVTCAFFAAGVSFAYWLVLPGALGFLLGLGTATLEPMISVTQYVDFLFGMLLAFGISFNLPVVLVGLVRAGVLRPRTLSQLRRQVIVLIFVAAAVLTPTPDVSGQLLLAAPLYLLYEASVLAARFAAPSSGRRTP